MNNDADAWRSLKSLLRSLFPLLGMLNAIGFRYFSMVLSKNIATLVEQARLAIENSLANQDILVPLQDYGYSHNRLLSGRMLYEALEAAQLHKRAAYGNQIGATAELNTAWEAAREHYMLLLKVARIAFKDDSAVATELGLKGDRAKSLTLWLAQANQFYANALESDTILTGLANFGITDAKLRAAQETMHAVEAASLAQEQAKGAAQRATQTRNVALEALRDWLSDFLAIAKIAVGQDN